METNFYLEVLSNISHEPNVGKAISDEMLRGFLHDNNGPPVEKICEVSEGGLPCVRSVRKPYHSEVSDCEEGLPYVRSVKKVYYM